MSDRLVLHSMPTPIGDLLIAADRHDRLHAVEWADRETRMRTLLDRFHRTGGYSLEPAGTASDAVEAIGRYLGGDLAAIDRLAVAPLGTPFEAAVWSELRQIPSGTTISYAQLAERIGKPRAIRASGRTNGLNPISIVVPCHRVVGSNGNLTGYGGGLARKRWLLTHEGALA